MMFDARRILSAVGENVVKVYDKTDGRQWEVGPGAPVPTAASATDDGEDEVSVHAAESSAAAIERVRVRDGYMVEGRRDGTVGIWAC